ncbi:10029_t:CDS:2 [Rhizophagus irregularis]|nr:10029_t:CDS:2 [Rhizophagus irregularis]
MVNKDKSEKPQLQSIQEKLRIWIDRYGYDLEDEDGRKEEQNIFRSMSKKIQKYFNKEFKGRIFSEYPKEEIEKALDYEMNGEFVWPEEEPMKGPPLQ